MKTRKYKNYTAIYLETISIDEFTKSIEKYKQVKKTEKYVVIRPAKKAIDDFIQSHPLLLSECTIGDSYELLGIQFDVVDKYKSLVTFSYLNRERKKEEITPFIQSTAPVAGVLLETIFEYVTGKLLYF
ncbi:hypothetical protein [Enterococcus sp. AZ134]|uniref:hypothetical protein n=1 Tax=Enterococcus sp. AZ134 TaxID=2774901 RepID=UPI003F259890